MDKKTIEHAKFPVLFILSLLLIIPQIQAQEISKMLVGTNLWLNPSTTVWNLTKECEVGAVRIGGHAYDDAMPSNAQLLTWVKTIQAMGAEPIMQVSQYGTTSATKAAALVKYFNIDLASGKPIKYWNIGNEPWLQAGKPALSTAGALVEAYFKPISIAMKEVDSTIKIFGPDYCYYIDEGMNDLFGGKNDISGKIPGKSYYYCDGISWHSYPQGTGSPSYEGVEAFRSAITKCKAKVDATNTLHNRTGDDALQWGIGEFNSKSGEVVHTWENGQMFGAILGMVMQNKGTYATTWSMFESGGSRTGTDFSYIDGNMTPRASYRHMQMVAQNFRGNYIKGKSSLTDIIVFGSKDADTISVMVMNRAATAPLSYTLNLSYDNTSGTGIKLNVDGASDLSYQDIIPGRATHLLVFKGGEVIKTTYTSSDFDNNRPPITAPVILAANIPSEPTSLVCTTLSEKAIKIDWQASENDTLNGFIIERKLSSGASFAVVDIVPGDIHTYTSLGLKDTTAYTFRVYAYNSAGKSAYSTEESATTLKLYRKAYKGPHYIPGKIEIENFDDNGEGTAYHDLDAANQGKAYRTTEGVDIEACTDAGLGYNIGYLGNGEWLIYSIDSLTSGVYDINLRYSSNVVSTKKVNLYMNTTLLGSFTPVSTGGWQVWKTLTLPQVTINKSESNLLKLSFVGADFNLNWIEFIKVNPVSVEPNNSLKELQIYPNPAGEMLLMELHSSALNSRYTMLDIAGKIVKTGLIVNGVNNVDISELDKGYYFIDVTLNNSRKISQSIIKI